MPLASEAAQPATEVSPAPPSPRPAGVNITLVAVIGTLLIAMGVGVLIGRSATGTSVKAAPPQVVTIAGASGTVGATPEALTPATASARATKAAKANGTSTTAHAKAVRRTSTGAPANTVKLGSTGKGAGYQRGHFTGNFFGPEAE